MKKILTLALAAAMLATTAIVVSANPSNSHTITAAYGTPVIDGQMDEIWNNAEMQVQDSFRSGTETDAKAQIRVMYDDNYLYVLEYVPDNTLWTSDLTLANYQYDTTECCISLTNSEASSYDGVFDWWVGITPYGVRNTDSNCAALIGGGTDVNDAEYLTVHTSLENDPENDTADGYWVEWAFNVKAIDDELVMDAGTTIGFEVSVNDNAEYNNRTMCMGWADSTDGASGNPSTFGNIVFGAKDGAAASAPAASTAGGAEPTILWDFNSDEEIAGVMSGANAVSYFGDTVDGVECFEFLASGNDPYVSINISADSVDDVVWAKARVKNPSYSTAIELFGATNGRSLAGSECTHIDLKSEDEAWYTYLIYIPDENVRTVNAYKDPQYAITEPYWAGTVEFIRLDPLWREGDDGSDAGGNMEGGESVYIDYIAFFPTKEDALAFRSELDNYAFPEQAGTAAAEEAPAVEEAPVYTYPASGTDGNLITGEIIGNEEGWGGNADAGRAAGFDGNPATFFDPLGKGDGFLGVQASESYILDKVAILSRDGWADRFNGAMIQGSNDGETWTTLWKSEAAAASTTEYTIVTEFENNTGYSMFRYFNETEHGDVAEVEFYGQPGKVEEAAEAPAEEVVEEVVEETAEEVVEEEAPAAEEVVEEAPQTFDFGVIAAVAALVSAAGYVLSKKR